MLADMQWAVRAAVMVVACGCEGSRAKPDAPQVAVDAEIDAALDAAMIDAPPDAPGIDAPSSSPACTTTPLTLLDVSPKQLVNMARSGNTLYVSATDDGQSAGAVVYTVDLATGTQPVGPMSSTGALQLWPTDGDAFGSEYLADGTIWQLHPGSTPVALIQHRPYPGFVTSEGGYVYWSEGTAGSSSQDHVKRRLIAGGAIEPVIDCSGTTRLVIDGTNIYCTYSSGILRKLKNGTGLPEGITYPSQGYPIFTLAKDGATLYFPAFGPGILYKIDTFGSAATAVTTVQNSPRIGGLALSADYYYAADILEGIRRIHRTTLVQEVVTTGSTGSDPVLWNNRLYFEAPDPQLSGQRYVKYCVD